MRALVKKIGEKHVIREFGDTEDFYNKRKEIIEENSRDHVTLGADIEVTVGDTSSLTKDVNFVMYSQRRDQVINIHGTAIFHKEGEHHQFWGEIMEDLNDVEIKAIQDSFVTQSNGLEVFLVDNFHDALESL